MLIDTNQDYGVTSLNPHQPSLIRSTCSGVWQPRFGASCQIAVHCHCKGSSVLAVNGSPACLRGPFPAVVGTVAEVGRIGWKESLDPNGSEIEVERKFQHKFYRVNLSRLAAFFGSKARASCLTALCTSLPSLP